MKKLYASGRFKADVYVLKSMGFDFCYYTRMIVTPNRKQRFFCYDMGYQIDNEDIQILLEISTA